MHLDSRSLHAPSALGVERRKEKNSCPAGLKPCTVVLADLELKCMDTFFPSAWYSKDKAFTTILKIDTYLIRQKEEKCIYGVDSGVG